ncbi:hypothetical protein Prudu_020653, partial [Prunus dulcis]
SSKIKQEKRLPAVSFRPPHHNRSETLRPRHGLVAFIGGAIRKRSPGSQFKFLVPLIYAPVLPLIRLSLRKNPVVRDRLFTAVLVGAFAHGFYLDPTQYSNIPYPT